MRLLLDLALRDLLRDWVYLLCNVAVLAGVIVPLLVMFGVRNGVYEALLGRLLQNPAILQIDTRGNNSFNPADAAEIRSWPEAAFVTLKTRSLFDYVNVRASGQTLVREAVAAPTGPGDPMLSPTAALAEGEVAVSSDLAEQLSLAPGAAIEIFTQAPERPRQLVIAARVALVLPVEKASGRLVLAELATLDLIEAFYDEYALPEHGVTAGKPLDARVPDFEGLRVYATSLETLAALQARIEARFGVGAEAATAQVTRVLGLGRNLGLALLLTASVAATGLAAALVFGFWGEVERKRRTIALLGLLGFDHRLILLFPMVQALATAMLGLAVSFLLFLIARLAAERLFETGLAEAGGLVRLSLTEALVIAAGVSLFVVVASLAAARSALRTDPAVVLREAA